MEIIICCVKTCSTILDIVEISEDGSVTSCPDLILCVGHILITEEASLPHNICFMYNVVISEIASSSMDGVELGSK